jgi:hypothetical protein
MKGGRIGNACSQHGSTGQQLECTQKIGFTHSWDIRGIYHVYTICIFQSLDTSFDKDSLEFHEDLEV